MPRHSNETGDAPNMRPLMLKELNMASFDGSMDDTDVDDADPRQCTDVCCLLVFVVYLCLMVHIFLFARDNGNIGKLTHGIDWRGEICGVDKAVESLPYLYWCNAGMDSVTDGICVEECPHSDQGHHFCPGDPIKHEVDTPLSVEGEYTVKITVERTVTAVSDMATTPLLNMYCLPSGTGETAKKLLDTVVLKGQLSGLSSQFMMALRGVIEAKWFLIAVAFGALALSFAFVYVLSVFVEIVVVAVVIIVNLVLLILGVYFTVISFHPDRNFFYAYTPPYAKSIALSVGGVFLTLWFMYTLMLFCSRQAIRVTCAAIRKACTTLEALPTLLLAPFVSLTMKLVAFLVLINGLGWVMSLGDIVPEQSPWETNAGVSVSGVGREIHFKAYQWRYLAVFSFGILWIHEVLVAMGQYAISHAVVIYTLNKDESCQMFPLTVGYINAITFHLGTLAFGGFVIGVLRVLTGVCAFVAKQAHNPDGSANMAVKAACCCCTCILQFLRSIMEMTNEMVYVDTVIQGTNYIKASRNVFKMLAENPETVALVRGMTKAVRTLGTCTIGIIGTYVTHWILTNEWIHSTMDIVLKGSSSMVYTSNVLGTTFAAAIICFGIGASFMIAFDQISDTLAYCILWRKSNGIEVDEYEALEEYDGNY